MISFSDRTLIEGNGEFAKVFEIMKKDGAVGLWMLKSTISFSEEGDYCELVAHFYNDTRIYIAKYAGNTSQADALRCFSKWCSENGWEKPEPLKYLIDNQREYEFWERMFQAGVIKCKEIEERENMLLERMQKHQTSEEDKFYEEEQMEEPENNGDK